jgi:predicted acetyltransferase
MSIRDHEPNLIDARGNTLTLAEPTLEHEPLWRAMATAYVSAGEPQRVNGYSLAQRDFAQYIRNLQHMEAGRNLASGMVPEAVYWLLRNGEEIVGESSIRLRLNAHLRHEGGHIGYQIRPDRRRRRYGTHILELTLPYAQRYGMKRVLVTCDTDNIGSTHIIERNGGVWEDTVVSKVTGKDKARYWIELDDEEF